MIIDKTGESITCITRLFCTMIHYIFIRNRYCNFSWRDRHRRLACRRLVVVVLRLDIRRGRAPGLVIRAVGHGRAASVRYDHAHADRVLVPVKGVAVRRRRQRHRPRLADRQHARCSTYLVKTSYYCFTRLNLNSCISKASV